MPVRIAAAVTALSLMFAPAALADTTTPTTLHVEGNGSVKVTPDVASLSVTVVQTAAKSSAALSAANQRVHAVVAAILKTGVQAKGIQTQSIDVSRHTIRVGPPHHKQKVRRYVATESLSVTSSASTVGHVIDAATGAGATSIFGPDFSFSDPSAGAVAATNAALADARRRADAAAKAIGYTVTGVQSVDLNPSSGVAFGGGSSGSASTPSPVRKSPAPTTVHPGVQEVDAAVDVVYTIAPA
jgi:uncharacterized protein YggE